MLQFILVSDNRDYSLSILLTWISYENHCDLLITTKKISQSSTQDKMKLIWYMRGIFLLSYTVYCRSGHGLCFSSPSLVLSTLPIPPTLCSIYGAFGLEDLPQALGSFVLGFSIDSEAHSLDQNTKDLKQILSA